MTKVFNYPLIFELILQGLQNQILRSIKNYMLKVFFIYQYRRSNFFPPKFLTLVPGISLFQESLFYCPYLIFKGDVFIVSQISWI